MSDFIADDREFLYAFESCTLPKAQWTHSAHVRMAWLQLENFKSFAPALAQIQAGIRRYNASVGSTGYNDTVTIAFTHLIHYRRLVGLPAPSWRDFLDQNTDLLAKLPPVLNSYYSQELLDSRRAFEGFVAADKKPLPAAGILRMATVDDAEAFLAIYAPYVERTAVTFEISVPTVRDFATRIQEILQMAPWLVYEVDGEVAGYAYGSQHRTREAYKWCTEVSVYVAEAYKHHGVGRLLYSNLLSLLSDLGYYNAYAGITLPNGASVGLHEAMGFTPIGVYRAIGHKMNQWHDVGWWQLLLQPSRMTPMQPKTPKDLPFETISRVGSWNSR